MYDLPDTAMPVHSVGGTAAPMYGSGMTPQQKVSMALMAQRGMPQNRFSGLTNAIPAFAAMMQNRMAPSVPTVRRMGAPEMDMSGLGIP